MSIARLYQWSESKKRWVNWIVKTYESWSSSSADVSDDDWHDDCDDVWWLSSCSTCNCLPTHWPRRLSIATTKLWNITSVCVEAACSLGSDDAASLCPSLGPTVHGGGGGVLDLLDTTTSLTSSVHSAQLPPVAINSICTSCQLPKYSDGKKFELWLSYFSVLLHRHNHHK